MKKFIRYFIGVVCWLATLLINVSLVRFIAECSNSNILDAIVAFIGGLLALISVPIAARLIVGEKVWDKYNPPKQDDAQNDHCPHSGTKNNNKTEV